jgi:type II secretory pathway component GspD/PulD (secretin)
VKVEISELDPGRAVNGIPALTTRNLETKINAKDGETVILSGLVRQALTQQRKSIPILSWIPLLGPLFFSSRAESRDETEVLMAVTYSLATHSREGQDLEKRRGRILSSKGMD